MASSTATKTVVPKQTTTSQTAAAILNPPLPSAIPWTPWPSTTPIKSYITIATQTTTSKMVPLVLPDEAQWFVDMGLGRGVDATKTKLWKEKSSFQVQSVSKSLDNIIVTDEGGARNYYEREISSVTSMQTQLKMSVADPHTSAQIGVENTFSQSISKTNKSVGEEVATRTISFLTSFDDLPLDHIDKETIKRTSKFVSMQAILPTTTSTESATCETVKSFEEQLSDWLIDRVRMRGELVDSSEDSSTARLSNYLRKSSEESREKIVGDCLMFIKEMGVTHYVHSIQLGAKKFRVLSISEFNRKVGVKGKAGVERLAKASVSQTMAWRRRSSSLNVKEIGKITDGSVKRGVGHESVISFKLMPIHTLVTLHQINHALKTALRDYMVEKAVDCQGPFLISCGSEKMMLFWKIDDSNKVIATPDIEMASMFFLTSTDDEDHPYEFMICYYHGEDRDVLMKPRGPSDPLSKEKPLAPIALYLNANVTRFGHNIGPLEVKSNVREQDARLVLHNRVFDGYEAVNYTSWMHGGQFYVNCSRRMLSWDGYLAVKKTKLLDYTTAIVPYQRSHNEIDTWLLFRLMPLEYKRLKSEEEPATIE